MKRISALCPAILFIMLLPSCSRFFSTPLEVTSWSPGTEFGNAPEQTDISITFNRDPEHIKTEEAFCMVSNGTEIPGRLDWNDTTLCFSPFSEIEENREYELILSSTAEDPYGNSLSENFSVIFRTGEKGRRPEIVSVSPENNTYTGNPYKAVEIIFDETVDFDALLKSFSITPDIAGTSVLDSGNKIFSFTPSEPWEWQQSYNIRISTELKSGKGYNLAEEFTSVFTVGTDKDPPGIVNAVSEDGLLLLTDSPGDNPEIIINSGWEKDGRIRLTFSEEINRNSALSSISVEPAAQPDIIFNESVTPAEMIIGFKEPMQWHELYRVRVSETLRDLQDNPIKEEKIYYLYINGSHSKPPEINRVNVINDGADGFCLFDTVNINSKKFET